MQKFTNFMVILTGAVVLMYLYKCMLNKQARKREKEDYKSIQQILAEQRDDLAQSKNPSCGSTFPMNIMLATGKVLVLAAHST